MTAKGLKSLVTFIFVNMQCAALHFARPTMVGPCEENFGFSRVKSRFYNEFGRAVHDFIMVYDSDLMQRNCVLLSLHPFSFFGGGKCLHSVGYLVKFK